MWGGSTLTKGRWTTMHEVFFFLKQGLFIDGAGQMIYTAWSASIFVLAYLKYSSAKLALPGKKAL